MSDAATPADQHPTSGPVREDDEELPDATTVWRAGHDRVATGPLRAQGDNVYNPEDEPLQAASDRPPRTTRGLPAADGAGLSSAPDGAARTGSGNRSDEGRSSRGRNAPGRVEPERDN